MQIGAFLLNYNFSFDITFFLRLPPPNGGGKPGYKP